MPVNVISPSQTNKEKAERSTCFTLNTSAFECNKTKQLNNLNDLIGRTSAIPPRLLHTQLVLYLNYPFQIDVESEVRCFCASFLGTIPQNREEDRNGVPVMLSPHRAGHLSFHL